MEVKKIKRTDFSWGVYDKKKKEFIEMFQTKEEAEKYLENLQKKN